MGDPRKQRKKYSTPIHPWQKDRIDAEKALSKEYGTRRKAELWKMNTLLKNNSQQAKNLIADTSEQGKVEQQLLLKKLVKLGLITPDAQIADVLSLTIKDIMNRRLQTIVYKQKLAHSLKQARQFIVHQHITVGGKTVSSPSYLVLKSDETSITFVDNSPFADEGHPERQVSQKAEKEAAAQQAAKDSAVETKDQKSKDDRSQDKKSDDKKADKKSTKEKSDDKKEKPEKEKSTQKAEEKPAEKKDKSDDKKDAKLAKEKPVEKAEDKPEEKPEEKDVPKKDSKTSEEKSE